MMRRAVAAMLLGLLVSMVGPAPDAHAAAPRVAKAYAHKLHCKHIQPNSMVGPANSGVSCKANNGHGKQLFYVLKYRNPKRAVRWWKDWITDGYFTRKGPVLVIAQGNNGRGGDWGYRLKWAQYAADRIDGQVIAG